MNNKPLSLLIVVFLLGVYWFLPFGETFEFEFVQKNSNFTLSSNVNSGLDFQFYQNMRYPSPEISYKIDNFPLQKNEEGIYEHAVKKPPGRYQPRDFPGTSILQPTTYTSEMQQNCQLYLRRTWLLEKKMGKKCK